LRPTETEKASYPIRFRWFGAAFLLGLTLWMFGGVLFTSRPVVLSNSGTDLASQFIYWRVFTAEQLRHGHLPLWNPYVYSGMPYLGWGQTGVLYPTNWLDLVLPLACSINLGIALHVFVAGLFTYYWGLHRGLHPVPATVAGVLFMFSGAYFSHVYAGHLSLLYAIAWTPLVFACVDEWIETLAWRWVLIAIAAITMQIFSGDFQACFYTALAATLLVLLGLIGSRQRIAVLLGFFGMYAAAAALGAVQLLTSFQASSESIRAGGLTYGFAALFSFPPENFLTLLAPGFFGDAVSFPYWGRWCWWEACLFIGVAGLMLAVYGAVYGRRESRRALILLLAVMLVLALGAYSPLFTFLYDYVPGFNRFRANAKFIIEASLALVMLAGAGLDRLLHDPKGCRWLAAGASILGVVAGVVAWQIHVASVSPQPAQWWSRAIAAIGATQESYLTVASYSDASFVKQAGVFASRCLLIAAIELLALGGLVFFVRTSRWLVYAVALAAIAEIFIFARSSLSTFDPALTGALKLKAFLDAHPGDYRIFYQPNPNVAIWLNKEDVWGSAPLVTKRYTEFMAFTQGRPVEGVNQYVPFSRFHPLYAILRWRYVFPPDENADPLLAGKIILPRLQLVQQYRTISDRDEILRAMDSPSFDPRGWVILESEPNPAPRPFAEIGTVRLLDQSANQLTVEADLPHPAILLITDAYSNGWRARPLDGSAQRRYDLLPADYVLRAIPLSEGHHHILIEYAPLGFRIGVWVSALSLFAFLVVIVLCARNRHPRSQSVLVS
jgi:hypothetical protein